ncbi:Actin-related protein, partial [Drosera capensis]
LLTGLVIDSGDGVTHVSNRAIPSWLKLIRHVQGSNLDVVVVSLKGNPEGFPFVNRIALKPEGPFKPAFVDGLTTTKYAMNRSTDFETIQEIKEKLCYISYDYKREYQLGLETTILTKKYTLPDGRVIKVGTERVQAIEALFTPELIDVEGDGMADMVFRCIQEMDIDNRMTDAPEFWITRQDYLEVEA